MPLIQYRSFWLLLISCTAFNAVAVNEDVTLKQANVIVFLVDDLGVMDTSVPFISNQDNEKKQFPLNEYYQTPNLTELATRGTRYSQFYAQSVCSPSRASLLTGQNAARHHITTWINPTKNNKGEYGPSNWQWQGLSSSAVTLPKLLQQSGFKTIHIGKGHFGPLNSEGANPLNLGFEVNIAGGAWGRPKSYYGKDHYGNHKKFKQKNKALTHNIPDLAHYYEQDTFLTEALTQEAIKQISLSDKQHKPFFLLMSHYGVHAPFQPDPRFIDKYQTSQEKEASKAFASLVEGVDKSLGDIVAHLNHLNIADNTLIIFAGDNGSDSPIGKNNNIATAAPFRGRKGTSWEGGMRAPLLIGWANESAQNPLPIETDINNEIATIMDIFPTVLATLQVPLPNNYIVDGENLLRSESSSADEKEFLMHFPHEHRHSYFTTYRKGPWKLIYRFNPANKKGVKQYQLYNLQDDLSESNDLSKTEPKMLYDMVFAMRAKLAQQGAQYPTNISGNTLLPQLPKLTN
ncbi:sulfatase-like hydrolase/transferase [Thalassotalea agarivorans]|nr:sulfatase-like hydrolase/transferase [Thalassotalea agarivorans]